MKKVRLWPLILSALLLWSLIGASGSAVATPTETTSEATPGPLTGSIEDELTEILNEDTADNSADDSGDASDDGADDTGDAPDDGADDTGDAPDDGADDTGDAPDDSADDTGDAPDDGADDTGDAPDDGADDTGDASDDGTDDTGDAPDDGADDSDNTNGELPGDPPLILSDHSSVLMVLMAGPPQKGSLRIQKNLSGTYPPANTDFTFSVKNNNGDEVERVIIKNSGGKTIHNLPVGTYTVEEVEIPQYWSPDVNTQTIEVRAGKTATVTFTNTYCPPPTGIRVVNEVTGNPPTDETFTFTIERKRHSGSWETVKTVNISGSGSAEATGLRSGTYRITQSTVPDNYSVSPSQSQQITVSSQNIAIVTFSNAYTQPTGSIEITKKFKGAPVPDGQEFTFTVYDSSDCIAGTVTITSGGPNNAIINDLPVGSYTVTESSVPYYTPDAVSKPASVTDGSTTCVTFTNTYAPPPPPTGIRIKKQVEGDPPSEDVFTFHIDYNWFGYWIPVKTVSITGAGSIDVTNLIPGVFYRVTENVPANYSAKPSSQQVIQACYGLMREVKFVNAYTPPTGSLEIIKTYTGYPVPDGEVFTFNVYQSETLIGSAQITSGGSNSVTIDNLSPGDYTVTEEAKQYYTALPASSTFAIVGGETTQVAFTNHYEPPSTAVLVLKSSDTGQRLRGVSFSLYRDSVTSANLIGSGITDLNGNIVFSGLRPGNYILVQSAVLVGYEFAENTLFTLGANDYTEELVLLKPTKRTRPQNTPTRSDAEATATPTPTPEPTPTASPTPIPSESVVTIETTDPPYGPATGEQTGLLITAVILTLIGGILLMIRKRILLKNAR